ncbi:RBBP9/YdeN family alpha/beta hydrolase [Propionivibrio soli]|uniref:RBBP9/YdeN family alpha/beta hydrolase n=1 Tax=Propionivibrio soli TaxID=2976531 RepID=UPI0021E85BEB|nr:alpha/beta hydrolase [Propionivibrio soli]
MEPTVLIVPGRSNSGDDHWQTHMEAHFAGAQRVHQDEWGNPALEVWSRRVDETVRTLPGPALLVAHSFGCLAAAHAQIMFDTPVFATLFVAPADPARFDLPRALFDQPLPNPGFLVASDNDPWMSHESAVSLAVSWGIAHVTLRNAGHINVASGYGEWPLGEALVARMRTTIRNAGGVRSVPPWYPGLSERSGNLHISK